MRLVDFLELVVHNVGRIIAVPRWANVYGACGRRQDSSSVVASDIISVVSFVVYCCFANLFLKRCSLHKKYYISSTRWYHLQREALRERPSRSSGQSSRWLS